MSAPAPADSELLDRLAAVLHELGLPCACQDEVERAVAVFAHFEARRTRRRLLADAREAARRIADYADWLSDLDDETASLSDEDLAGVSEAFRVIASTAADGAAALDLLARRGAAG